MELPIYDSERCPSPIVEELQQLFRYRELVVQLVRRDITMRYKRSVLGVAWTMLNPLGMMVVLTLVFSHVFETMRGYAVYLLTGLLVWNFFAQSTVLAMRHLVWGGNLIQRIYVPKAIFAVAAIGTGLVNLFYAFIPLVAVMLVTGLPPRPAALAALLYVPLLAAFALGVALLLSTAAAHFADVAEMYEIALVAWVYLTPIIYPEDVIPEPLRWWIFTFNPMHHLIRPFRISLYEGLWPDASCLVLASIAAASGLIIGWVVFARKSNELSYRL